MKYILDENTLDEKKKKKQPYDSITITTGDPSLNIKHFNKMMGTDFTNPSTEEAKAQKAAEIVSAELSGNISSVGEGATSEGAASENVGAIDGGCTLGEELLAEAKRYIRRYYIRPQNIFCSNKTDIINALIEIGNKDCTIYTLNNLGDEKDVTKLTNKDIIYYYNDGILYDKNMVKVMDYDLYIKHEEKRKQFTSNIETIPEKEFSKEYDDRITGDTTDIVNNKPIESTKPIEQPTKESQIKEELENEFNLEFEARNAFGESLNLTEDKSEISCCICGEPIIGIGNNPEPYMPAESGMCCDACNTHFVIPARLAQLNK